MGDRPQLVAPLCVVIMDDGSEFEVQATNWDLLSYERYARAHKWPPADQAPMETATFVAWHALKREGCITDDMSYDLFTTAALSVETRRAEVDPTQAGPGGD